MTEQDTSLLIFSQSSLKILRHGSLEILSHLLNPRKILLTSGGKLRDYRGLAELAGLDDMDMKRVEAADGTGRGRLREVVSIWCAKRGDVSVGDLWRALEELDRFDVQEEAAGVLLKDCQKALETIGANNRTDLNLQNALTLHDFEALQNGKSLTKYDAMILHGDEPYDEDFACHLTQRMEEAGLTVCIGHKLLKVSGRFPLFFCQFLLLL